MVNLPVHSWDVTNRDLAGISLTTATGSQTGVYVGCFTSDYNDIIVKDLDLPSKYSATGTVASMLSNRVSWFYDFRGPSITIDTACSSSLVAAHEACMSLKLREISMVCPMQDRVCENADDPRLSLAGVTLYSHLRLLCNSGPLAS